METTSAPAGWHPDPSGRFEFRYFNGQRWTSDVAVHGQRFVDDLAAPMHQPGWAASGPARGRGMALASFWVAFGSFFLAWLPFVFALGAAGGVTAIVFGVVALQRVRRRQAPGRAYATAGIILSVAALGASVVGFNFTRSVMRQIDDFLDVGPHAEQIDSCVLLDGLVTLDGTITNNDTVSHRYTVTVSYREGRTVLETENVNTPAVAAGATAHLHSTAFVDAADVQCTIDAVNGPTPFAPRP